jgi:membrane associated rhomboid family serine protease
MLSCGLIHADWFHFAFNAISFYSFAGNIEAIYGAKVLLPVYIAAILGGSLLFLIIHLNHEYFALGASGGVCGVIFASIFLLPGSSVTIFPIPVGIPAYLYAILFLAGSFIAHRRQKDNIGHDAHLGGAIIGLLVAAALYPQLIFAEPWLFLTVILMSSGVLALLILDPLRFWNFRITDKVNASIGGERERRYDENNKQNQKITELDKLLDQVARGGINSLSKAQRTKMEQLSTELYGKK